MEDGLLKIAGAQESAPDKFTTLATIRFLGGIQTQRSPFAGIASRYDAKYLGGKPDALIAGSNVEISNRLTIQRRPGLLRYGSANIPAPVDFYNWQLATTEDIILVIDTETSGGDNNAGANGAVFNYSTSNSGIYFNKSQGSKQTNFMDVVNTLYMGDGVDLYKNVGPNLLYWSNTFGNGSSPQSPWTSTNATFTQNQSDPSGGTTATEIVWSASGTSSNLTQVVTPNYTPVAKNTFTLSIWMKAPSTQSITLFINDQSGNIGSKTVALMSTWTKYQLTVTMGSGSTEVSCGIFDPSTTNAMYVYGGQLEVGGPATTTQITTVKPQGIYLWGITAPTDAPTFTTVAATGSTGKPWQPNTAYNVGDTIVDSNGNLQYATNGGIKPELDIALISVQSGTGIYNFASSQSGAANNGYVGLTVVITGFTIGANNGTFTVTASSSTQLTTNNSSSNGESASAQAAFGKVGTAAGTSGGSQPDWNTSLAGLTQDGIQALVAQSAIMTAPSAGSTASLSFASNVTAANTLIVAVYVSHPGSINITDTASDSFTLFSAAGFYNPISIGQFTFYLYYCLSAAGGATTINVSGGGSTGTFIAACELSDITAVDGFASTGAQNSSSIGFITGGVTTTNARDVILTVGSFEVAISSGSGAQVGNPPNGYSVITGTGPTSIASNTALINMQMAFITVGATGFYDPNWSVTNPTSSNSANLGFTAGLKTAVSPLEWFNLGSDGAGLTAKIGYQWYFSLGNSYTGHFSNVSPISASTGIITGQDVNVTGNIRTMSNSGGYSTDPQSDLIALYRNTDGGGFFFQVALFGNGATVQTALAAANYPGLTTEGSNPGEVSYSGSSWTFIDNVPDDELNTSIFAPIGLLNSPPPAGLKNLEYFAGRMWGSVNGFLYYNTSADNASLLGVQQNGVPAESWIATNNIPFNSANIRNIALGGGLLVGTITDMWFVTGQNLLTGGFNAQKAFAGHGIRSYNSVDLDGSSVYLYTSDRELLVINPNSGSVEIGYAIGDYLEENFNPLNVYIARHIAGSQDNAVFIADGISKWFRLNPNQQGASLAGEQTPVFSPVADFSDTIGGIGAIASIETSAGIHQLLVGQTGVGPVLVRNLTTFTDDGDEYAWSATIGSILLTTPGKIAECESITTEMNSNTSVTQCGVAILLDEIEGGDSDFEELPASANDPPQLPPSQTVLSNRFYLMQAAGIPMCRHLQIQLTGSAASTKDELLALTIRGTLENEQL